MSSIQMSQVLWPTIRALPVFVPRWLPIWWRQHPYRSAMVGPVEGGFSFGRDLLLATERTIKAHRLSSGLVTVVVELSGEPHPRHEALLLLLASALVEDALTHSFSGHEAGKVVLRGGRIGAEFRLIVEDDGWQPRSTAAWMTDIAGSRAAAAQAGGRLRREVEWASNRTTVALPV